MTGGTQGRPKQREDGSEPTNAQNAGVLTGIAAGIGQTLLFAVALRLPGGAVPGSGSLWLVLAVGAMLAVVGGVTGSRRVWPWSELTLHAPVRARIAVAAVWLALVAAVSVFADINPRYWLCFLPYGMLLLGLFWLTLDRMLGPLWVFVESTRALRARREWIPVKVLEGLTDRRAHVILGDEPTPVHVHTSCDVVPGAGYGLVRGGRGPGGYRDDEPPTLLAFETREVWDARRVRAEAAGPTLAGRIGWLVVWCAPVLARLLPV